MAEKSGEAPALEPKPKIDPLADAKAAFDKLLAKQKGETTTQQVAPPEVAEEAAPKEETVFENTPEEEPEEKPKEKPKAKKADESEKLRARLLLAGNPKKAIESLSEDELREWWKKQEEREQANAQALQRASELERKLKETAKTAEPVEVPTAEMDLDELAGELSDQFGEDESKSLAKVLRQMVEPLRKENARIMAVLDEARKRGVEDIANKNRKRLAKELPALSENEDAWRSIRHGVQEAFEKDPHAYSSAEDAFDDVFQKLYGWTVQQTPPAKDLAKEKARIEASSSTPPSSQKRERVYSPMDAHRAAFTHLLKNSEDVDGARAAFNRLKPQ